LHELSIAQSLLDIVVNEAQTHGVSRVLKVGIKLGAFTNVVGESLRF
jgi:hydrogenase nickel incorporation protein HypA/HybF